MEALTVSTTINRPREEVFAYLADIANHPEFNDHYLVDWRLTREDSFGEGAGARFTIDAPRPRQRYAGADVTLIDVEAPWRLVLAGRGGKFNRVRLRAVYELQPASGGTRVDFTVETKPKTLPDKLLEGFGFRGWLKRKSSKALKRLRSILEDNEGRGQRATVAGR
jgi:uncharacterized protein YndB with AHSA1/START domain